MGWFRCPGCMYRNYISSTCAFRLSSQDFLQITLTLFVCSPRPFWLYRVEDLQVCARDSLTCSLKALLFCGVRAAMPRFGHRCGQSCKSSDTSISGATNAEQCHPKKLRLSQMPPCQPIVIWIALVPNQACLGALTVQKRRELG